jgi:hypothetical protein
LAALAPSGTNQFAAIQAVAPSLMVEVTPVGLRDTDEIERAGLGLGAFSEWRAAERSGGP